MRSLIDPIENYYDVFDILGKIMVPKGPACGISNDLSTTVINLFDVDVKAIRDYLEKHRIPCQINGWSDEESTRDLFNTLSSQISGAIRDLWSRKFSYDQAIGAAGLLIRTVGAKAKTELKSDKTLDLKNVDKTSVMAITGKLCDVWVNKCGEDVRFTEFKPFDPEGPYDEDQLYEAIIQRGTNMATKKSQDAILNAKQSEKKPCSKQSSLPVPVQQDASSDSVPRATPAGDVLPESAKKSVGVLDLPNEVLETVSEYLPLAGFLKLQTTCKAFRQVLGKRLWRTIYITDKCDEEVEKSINPPPYTRTCSPLTVIHPACCHRRCIRITDTKVEDFISKVMTSESKKKKGDQTLWGLNQVRRIVFDLDDNWRRCAVYHNMGVDRFIDLPDGMGFLNGVERILMKHCPNITEFNLRDVTPLTSDQSTKFSQRFHERYPNAIFQC